MIDTSRWRKKEESSPKVVAVVPRTSASRMTSGTQRGPSVEGVVTVSDGVIPGGPGFRVSGVEGQDDAVGVLVLSAHDD